MQTGQIPLSLLGVKRFDYSPKQLSGVVYDPSKQTSNMLSLTGAGADTVSDLSTGSGFFQNHDDEERGVDD